MEEKLSKS